MASEAATRTNSLLALLNFAAALAIAFLAWQLAKTGYLLKNKKETPPRPEFYDWVDPAKGVKILMFYPAEAAITEGDTATICFGVANAKAVRIEPPIDRLWPTINRCIADSPSRDTRYTLTAEDAQGRQVTESFVLKVLPDPARAPRIAWFRKSRETVDNGKRIFTVCFRVWNSTSVHFNPPLLPDSALFEGCLYAAPDKTTTYTLTATGRHGEKVQQTLTLEVP